MTLRLLALFFIITFQTYAQSQQNKEEIITEKTDQHINIPGTRLFIIPPNGFEPSNSFTGLQKGENSAIQVYDLVGGNYNTNAKTFSKEGFENRGVTVQEYKELIVNGFPAKYALIQGDPSANTINLVFGDTTFSTMVLAIYPSYENSVEKEIKEAIQSIYYDKEMIVDPFVSAKFTLDDSKSIFKFAKSTSGLFLYSIGGVDKQSYEDEPFVMVSTFPKESSMTAESVALLMQNSLKSNGLTIDELKNKVTSKLDGKPTYEEEIHGTLNGQKSIIYQLIVEDEEKIISLQGILKSELDKNLIEIKKLSKTLKLK